jgi:hypothetical protein
MWNEVQDAKFLGEGPLFTRTEWDKLLGSYSPVSSDAPALAFSEELIVMYPEAKVVLVERDIDEWYTSFDAAVTGPM